jgi:hypothetical protein
VSAKEAFTSTNRAPLDIGSRSTCDVPGPATGGEAGFDGAATVVAGIVVAWIVVAGIVVGAIVVAGIVVAGIVVAGIVVAGIVVGAIVTVTLGSVPADTGVEVAITGVVEAAGVTVCSVDAFRSARSLRTRTPMAMSRPMTAKMSNVPTTTRNPSLVSGGGASSRGKSITAGICGTGDCPGT